MAQFSSGYIPLAYAYSSNSGSGRISLPVAPSEVLYANFEHVAGVAAGADGGAISIDALKILDALIDRLESIKREPLQAAEAPKDLSPGRVDALIQQYGSELHAIASAPSRPYVAKPAVTPGSVISLAA